MIEKSDESTFLQISGVFATHQHVHRQSVVISKPSYVFKQAHLLESITSDILDL